MIEVSDSSDNDEEFKDSNHLPCSRQIQLEPILLIQQSLSSYIQINCNGKSESGRVCKVAVFFDASIGKDFKWTCPVHVEQANIKQSVQKDVKVFFRTNKSTCNEWF